MNYPIGIQTFEKIRKGDYVYVDKTDLIYNLVRQGGGYYFFSRPRRFGKSLLISTLDAYFRGKRDLFRGLAIDQLEKEWTARPVFHIDMSGIERGKLESIETRFNLYLSEWEEEYGIKTPLPGAGARFAAVIRAAHRQTGQQVAILVDEYDAPILANMESDIDTDEVRAKLKAFYTVLKSEDQHIYFGILTGVTRFSKVSVFSDLNNLEDISMDKAFVSLCGITEKELHAVFDEQVGEMAEDNEITKDECYARLAKMYDGYHFAPRTVGIYNPFSLLKSLKAKEFGSYWFASGTPTFLVRAMQRTDFDLIQDFSAPVSEGELSNVDTISSNVLPVLFQSGYLTIVDFNPRLRAYTLGFPNEEVREGFICNLSKYFTAYEKQPTPIISRILNAINAGDTETLMQALKQLFDKSGNCMIYQDKSLERDFRNIVYIVFCFLDIYSEAELCTPAGRMDICCRTDNYNYIIEIKIDQSPDVAIQQIKANHYPDKLAGEGKPLVLLGVNFSSKTNTIDDWRAETI